MSDLEQYESHDAIGLARLVRRGEVGPTELLEAAIARVEERNPSINAVVIKMYDEARAAIRAGLPDGPLRCVPFLVKDLHVLVAGGRTTHGSRLFADFVADHDSELVARYKRAGLVIFGRTATSEFGLCTSTDSALFGPTRNPWKRDSMAGGSSGGSAAAVAARIVPAAHASDGGGSIRIPAACCGVFGLKPTRARNPSGPDAGEGWSGMSTAHAVSRSVRDSAALLDATSGPDLGDPYWAPPPARPFLEEIGADPGRLRIAYTTQAFNGAKTDADCVLAVEDAAKLCADLGHDVEEAVLTVDAQRTGRASLCIIAANTKWLLRQRASALGRELLPDDVEMSTAALAKVSENMGATDYADAIRVLHDVGRRVSRFLQPYDLLLTPTMACAPLPLEALGVANRMSATYLDDLARTVAFTQLFNLSGHPAMSVPLLWNAEGLPVGVQFAGRFGDEATLFRLAAQLEQARPWAHRRPAV